MDSLIQEIHLGLGGNPQRMCVSARAAFTGLCYFGGSWPLYLYIPCLSTLLVESFLSTLGGCANAIYTRSVC
jgi:hypothetical protein